MQKGDSIMTDFRKLEDTVYMHGKTKNDGT